MYTLLTGATGLVGRYLVRDLLLNGHQLAVVVRENRRMSADDRMEQIMQHWENELGRSLPRPVVLTGDISEPGFAFSDEDRQWVAENCDTIIHSAAILEFYGEDRNGEPWRTNLGGTRNMIQLCRELDIRDIHYVSTAYVAGLQTERVMEDQLDVGQSFRNDYEESKFLAEKEVRAIDFADHVTVYRPAVIAGDSNTGYTNTYHGIYLYLRLVAMLVPAQPADENGVRHTPIRLAMTGEESRNIIPVDWVSAVMVRLFETPEARGGTYHMAPDKPMKSGDMVRWCGEYYNSTGVEFMGHDFIPDEVSRDDNEDQWLFERLVRENMGTYEPYERTDNVFDMSQMKRFAGDIVCPEIDRTIVFRYLEYGTEDRWGKRRPPKPEVSVYARDILQDAVSAASDADTTGQLGIDVYGPGGGQFTLTLSDSGVTGLKTGLPGRQDPVLRLSVQELHDLLRNPGSADLRSRIEQTTPEEADRLASQLSAALASGGEVTSAG